MRSGTASYVRESTDFCIGAAAYPEDPSPAERIGYFKLKIDAGAEYGITQMLFDESIYSRFLRELSQAGISAPILPGFRVLRSKEAALKMAKRFKVSVASWMMDALPSETEGTEMERAAKVSDVFFEYVRRLRAAGAPGVHVFVLSDTADASSLISRLCSM